MARTSQFPKDPQLPRPDAYGTDAFGYAKALGSRLFILFKTWIDSFNLLIQGYLYTVVSAAALPTANAINQYRLIMVTPGGANTDSLRLCFFDGTSFAWATVPLMLVATASWTPGAIANGASITQTFTVTDVAVGQTAHASINPAGASGLVAIAMVTAANTVAVTLLNLTGGITNPGTVTVTISVF